MRGKNSKSGCRIKSVFIALIFVFVFFGFYTTQVQKASASFLERIPFSATMLDAKGSPIADGNYPIVFRFYATPTSGSTLWEESQTVATEKGKFETLLGSITGLASLNFDQTLYVSIQVALDKEMLPRKQVGATPQALIAKRATSLIAPAGSEIEALGSLHISEGLRIEGDGNFNGKLVFGNNAEIRQDGSALSLSTSLLPAASGLDIGSATKNWSDIYADTLALKKGVAPTALSGYGQLYTATDNTLHFINEAGTDTSLLSSNSTLKVQELVKDFTAESGESIAAGNLVSYLNGKVRKGEIQKLNSPGVFESASTANISAATLSTNKIAVSYSDLGNGNFGTTIIGTISGSTVSWGTASVFAGVSTYNASNTPPLNISMVALSSDKIAVSYTDTINSSFGTTVIGTITGTTIAWGTPSVFESASTNFISSSALSADKIAISYSDIGNTNFGTTIIGTVAGNAVAFGTASVFESASTNYISTAALSADKISINYNDQGNTNFGTGIIGSVSGTSISWGSPVVFKAASTSNISSTALSSDKIAISYSDMSNAEFGTAVIGTIANNTLSFGTASVFESYSTYDPGNTFIANSAIIALSSDKIVISYQDHGNSKHGTTIIGNISGTAITWNTATVFENARTEFISALVLSPDKIALGYQDVGNSSFGTFTINSMEPYLGVSKNACSVDQTCSVAIKGVVSNLSSLSTGAVYYTGADGVLTTTPYPNRVGTAVSTTEIVLDGKWDSGDMMVSDLIFKNSFRMTEFQNSTGAQGLVMYDQNTKPIIEITDSGKLSLLGLSVGASYTGAVSPPNGLIVEGNVGIGMSAPTAKLHVTGSAGTIGIELSSHETINGSNIMVLRSDYNISLPNKTVFRVQADGKVYADGAYTGTGADYAEYFANEEAISAKTLVGLNGESGKARKYQSGDKLIGIVSANAGFIGNSTNEIEKDPGYTLVALMGQVDINSDQINIVNGTVYSLDGIQIGNSLLGGKVLINIVMPDAKVNKLLLSFDQDGALLLGAGSKLYSKSEGLLTLDGSLEVIKNLYIKGKFITPASGIQYLNSDSKIDPNASKVKIAGKDAAVILTGEQIEPGEDGQNLIIQGGDDTNTLTIQSQSVLAESIIKMSQPNRILGKGDILILMYDATDGIWYEAGYANNQSGQI